MGTAGCIPEDLVAQRNSVVREALLGIVVDRLLVLLNRRRDVSGFDVEIAQLVEKRQFIR